MPWAGALDGLEYMLGKLPRNCSGSASVVLSNLFVRYVNVPWTAGVHSEKDRVALATSSFRALYGDVVESWRVVLDAPKYGCGNLAAAIDEALVDRLRELLAERRWRLVSVRPHLSAAFDRWRSSLEAGDGCFVVVEPGCVTALFRRGKEWTSVDSRRFYRKSAIQGAVTFRQCIDADRMQGGEGAVALFAPGTLADVRGTVDRPLRRLAGVADPWPNDPWRSLAWSAA